MIFVGTGIYVVAGIVYAIIYLINKFCQFPKLKEHPQPDSDNFAT